MTILLLLPASVHNFSLMGIDTFYFQKDLYITRVLLPYGFIYLKSKVPGMKKMN